MYVDDFYKHFKNQFLHTFVLIHEKNFIKESFKVPKRKSSKERERERECSKVLREIEFQREREFQGSKPIVYMCSFLTEFESQSD